MRKQISMLILSLMLLASITLVALADETIYLPIVSNSEEGTYRDRYCHCDQQSRGNRHAYGNEYCGCDTYPIQPGC